MHQSISEGENIEALATEGHLFTNGETADSRRKRWDREKSLPPEERNTLYNDYKH
jgi:hypothetical protein